MIKKFSASLRKKHIEIVKQAAEHCGSQRELAEKIGFGISQGQVAQWIRGVRPVSPHHAVMLERAVPGIAYREQLHPELYKGFERTQ